MLRCTRRSLEGSSGWSGSVHASRLPLPLVSRMSGVQPCARSSSPVSSNTLRLSQPMTPVPNALLTHTVLLASSAKIRWCVGKQVEMSVHLPEAGSYIERCRPDSASGYTFAEGWLEPCLQKSGLAGWRTRAANHGRPFSSIIGLWLVVCASQIGFGPQYGDGCIGLDFDDGVFGSRTGCFTSLTVLDRG